ncbi:hypothetical protein PGTUg99_032761 [Puccinia graminis f. sp. tritici]|uniref:Uncharacterized protein n=1 Tax=Puccinia graminis f. sp. tritici TaxID=56615 RepID=A0A5B0RQI9_PUCGR|nr:hypothetical protein PGTUg99_032761 [Puccinia graminis f. sp. tritici]
MDVKPDLPEEAGTVPSKRDPWQLHHSRRLLVVDEVGHPNLSSPRAQPQLNKGSTSSDRWLTGGGNSLSAGSELPALYDSVVIRLSTPGLLAESA